MIKVRTKKIINLLEVLEKLQDLECKQLKITRPKNSHHVRLADGSPGIFDRVWKTIANMHYGNQTFSNDSLFMLPVECLSQGDKDMRALVQLCEKAKAVNAAKDGDGPLIIFDVCW